MSTLTRRDKGIIPEIFELLETPFLGVRPLRLEGVVRDGRYVLRAELPGIDPEDVEVTLTSGVLTIHAERHREDTDAVHTEFRYGSLTRSVTLPQGAQETDATAVYDKGILEITLKLSDTKEAETRIPVTVPK
ncbi:Hsp20/alpha crystallin family protein [Herbidospora sp. NBRC 101105]|uniref:Hsp20/alpha crystallin family protein n=1 Tax=Herbidospora sp. NBRC 101105 TaxID=3032195 RepID=UPI0024A31B08|nr:Hsp20/alpha crystallin family protein [Herbidospora sp. NBRC 101105]GLX99533.1 alpha-crystallin [Herbidospora sp. NBRC 101105]